MSEPLTDEELGRLVGGMLWRDTPEAIAVARIVEELRALRAWKARWDSAMAFLESRREKYPGFSTDDMADPAVDVVPGGGGDKSWCVSDSVSSEVYGKDPLDAIEKYRALVERAKEGP